MMQKFLHNIIAMIREKLFPLIFTYFFISCTILYAQFDTTVLSSIVAIEKIQKEIKNPYISTETYDSFFTFSNTKNIKKNKLSNIVGTGIIIKKEKDMYYVLSNNHVVEDADTLWITLYDETFVKGIFHSTSKKNDIAIIRFESKKEFPIAKLQTKIKPKIGEQVYAVGNPYGFTFTVTKGIISGLNRNTDFIQGLFIQTDAALNPGNSGGAIVNNNGEIIGISTWIFSPLDRSQLGLNFAIDVRSISNTLSQLIDKKTINYSWLGITIQLTNPSILHNLNIENRNAVIISNIFSTNHSILNNLKIGDVITAIDYQTLKLNSLLLDNYNSIFPIIANKKINSPIAITLIRNNKTIQISLTTKKRPQQKAIRNIQSSLWPGYTAYPLSPHKNQIYGLKSDQFALFIDEVYEFTSAKEAGLESYDIILDINNQKVQSYYDYFHIINNALLQGKEIYLKTLKNGSSIDNILFYPPIIENKVKENTPLLLTKK